MIETILDKSISSKQLNNIVLRRWPTSSGVDISHKGKVHNGCKGVVIFVGQDLDGTWCVCVQIDSKQLIRYTHLSEEFVSPNDAILEGVELGRSEKWFRIEYCTSNVEILEPTNIVRIGDCTYFKTDSYPLISGEVAIEIQGTSAYDLSQSGLTTDYTQIINKELITPFVATLDTDVTSVKAFKELKSHDVVCVMLYGGGLYDSIHLKKSKYTSNTLKKQVQSAKEAGLLYSLVVDVCARSIPEAQEECKHLYHLISMYPPQLGLWLNLSFIKSKSTNDSILEYYEKQTYEWGLKGQVGLYCNESQLDKISWKDRWCEYYLLWLIRHDSRYIETTDSLLTPADFKLV